VSRPYVTREEAYAELAHSPVVGELRGHPKAIVMFAPLLEDNQLDGLLNKARECYNEAIRGQAEADNGGGGEGADGEGADGAALREQDAPALEMDAASLEREAEEARRYLRDPNCQRIWLDVRTSRAEAGRGGAGHTRGHTFVSVCAGGAAGGHARGGHAPGCAVVPPDGRAAGGAAQDSG
jgi:hypothetical protein